MFFQFRSFVLICDLNVFIYLGESNNQTTDRTTKQEIEQFKERCVPRVYFNLTKSPANFYKADRQAVLKPPWSNKKNQ